MKSKQQKEKEFCSYFNMMIMDTAMKYRYSKHYGLSMIAEEIGRMTIENQDDFRDFCALITDLDNFVHRMDMVHSQRLN